MTFLDSVKSFFVKPKTILDDSINSKIDELTEIIKTQERLLKDNNVSYDEKTLQSRVSIDSKDIYGTEGLKKYRKTPLQLTVLYFTNQFIFRAVNIRADELIARGYELKGSDEKGIIACQELIDNSGGLDLFYRNSINCDVCGDAFLEKVYNKNKKKILKLKHIHPVTFGFKKDLNNCIILDDNNMPISYYQEIKDGEGKDIKINVPIDRVEHLMFSTYGDEFIGVSLLQSVYDTTVRLMNMENAAANASVKAANPLLVGRSETNNPSYLATWSKLLGKLTSKEQVFLPKGMQLEMLSPGKQNFNEYADYFLNAVVVASGCPKALLLGGSDGGGNRAELVPIMRHFYGIIRRNQFYMQEFINKIFKEYGEIAGFEAPKLAFNEIAEDAEITGAMAIQLYTAGIITKEEARQMIGQIDESVTTDFTVSTDKAIKDADLKTWHPSTPASPISGSQAGNKKSQARNPSVQSVPYSQGVGA